jgi:hypothetical protein
MGDKVYPWHPTSSAATVKGAPSTPSPVVANAGPVIKLTAASITKADNNFFISFLLGIFPVKQPEH